MGHRLRRVLHVAAGAAILVSGSGIGDTPAHANSTNVIVRDTYVFRSASIDKNELATWTNLDGYRHTLTSCGTGDAGCGETPVGDGKFRRVVNLGQTAQLGGAAVCNAYAPFGCPDGSQGTLRVQFFCEFHSPMRGYLDVTYSYGYGY